VSLRDIGYHDEYAEFLYYEEGIQRVRIRFLRDGMEETVVTGQLFPITDPEEQLVAESLYRAMLRGAIQKTLFGESHD
jgi:hypothetical protein